MWVRSIWYFVFLFTLFYVICFISTKYYYMLHLYIMLTEICLLCTYYAYSLLYCAKKYQLNKSEYNWRRTKYAYACILNYSIIISMFPDFEFRTSFGNFICFGAIVIEYQLFGYLSKRFEIWSRYWWRWVSTRSWLTGKCDWLQRGCRIIGHPDSWRPLWIYAGPKTLRTCCTWHGGIWGRRIHMHGSQIRQANTT